MSLMNIQSMSKGRLPLLFDTEQSIFTIAPYSKESEREVRTGRTGRTGRTFKLDFPGRL